MEVGGGGHKEFNYHKNHPFGRILVIFGEIRIYKLLYYIYFYNGGFGIFV